MQPAVRPAPPTAARSFPLFPRLWGNSLSSFSLTTFESLFDLGDSGRTFSTLQQSHRDAIAALSAVLLQIAKCSAHSDDELLTVTRYSAEERRLVDAVCAVAAGEIARRSAPELGSTGLAQRTGHRTAQELVQVTTGSTARDAATSVRVGTLTVDAVSDTPTQPWLRAVGQAVAAGTLSASAADAIRVALGSPTQPRTHRTAQQKNRMKGRLNAGTGSLQSNRQVSGLRTREPYGRTGCPPSDSARSSSVRPPRFAMIAA